MERKVESCSHDLTKSEICVDVPDALSEERVFRTLGFKRAVPLTYSWFECLCCMKKSHYSSEL